MKYRYTLIFLLLGFLTFSVYGEVSFSRLNLSDDGILLFRATTESPMDGAYSTLFKADLGKGDLQQLTFFPEHASLINGGERLQIQNRFGVFRTDEKLAGMAPIKTFPAFVNGEEIQTGKIATVGASPDGRYLLYLEPESYGYAALKLYHIGREEEYLISTGVEMVLNSPNATWSPDSGYFVYQKQGNLYYFSMDQLISDRIIDESFRILGKGRLSSTRWSRRNDLFYVTGNLVYQILSPEFFTRSIYTGLFDVGHIAGKIPFEFDPAFDSYWISPDGGKILFNKGGQNIFLYLLQPDDYISTGDATALPYLYLPRNTVVKDVAWSSSGIITLLTNSLVEGSRKSGLFRLNLANKETRFTEVEAEGVTGIAISPNQERCVLLYNDKAELRNYYNFAVEQTISYQNPLHALWRSSTEIILCGNSANSLYSLDDNSLTLISLAQYSSAGFNAEGDILIQQDNKTWTAENDLLVEADGESLLPAKVAAGDFRVFIEDSVGNAYQDTVMIRDLKNLVTRPLFRFPAREYDLFPKEDENIDLANFSHGSRIRRREVSLVFNAIDSVEGLTYVLHTLKDYDIRGTFFLNGEFIRRHPDAVKEISQSGHEVGSLFYAYFDMTDSRFQINKDFIKRGLARNEDDYFAATGDELSLLWHAPFYFVNSEIIAASSEMNYTYIGRDVDPLDWITPYSTGRLADLYSPAADIVERILKNKRPGSIIPLRIGKTSPEREDYLFHSLDIMIDELISLGYEIVPVSQLMAHAR